MSHWSEWQLPREMKVRSSSPGHMVAARPTCEDDNDVRSEQTFPGVQASYLATVPPQTTLDYFNTTELVQKIYFPSLSH